MSSPSQKDDLLAGHPPADGTGCDTCRNCGKRQYVKVGGMRVGQHHTHHPEQKPSERAKEEEEFQTEKQPDQQVLVSGVVAKGDKDFPKEAVKVAHDKPMPTHEKPPNKGGKGSSGRGPDLRIHQPRGGSN